MIVKITQGFLIAHINTPDKDFSILYFKRNRPFLLTISKYLNNFNLHTIISTINTIIS
jgi:hypothetical protein